MSKERLTDYIEKQKICDYIQGWINPYGKPFGGTTYEFGLKIMEYIENSECDKTLEEHDKKIRVKVIEEMKELVRGHKYTNAEDGTTIEEMLKDENTERKYAWYLSRNQCCDWMLHRLDEIAEQMKEVGE